ncbi:MAG: hypothetical protein U9N42_03895, partial [Campylobacterota bacterium]|nr:hypothetical protein [Campylobacterota bacterium]
DSDGVYIQHALEKKDDSDKLYAINSAILEIAITVVPLKLLESVGSSATEYKMVSSTKYVRQPNEAVIDGELDIDESLAYAVIYKAINTLYDGNSDYNYKAKEIITSYADAYRDYILDLEDTEPTEVPLIFFRFSADGVEFHDNFIDGDTFISFKQGDSVWSQSIKFVGDNADPSAGGTSGASTFLELTDTPTEFIGNKQVEVNSEGDALVFVDKPTIPTQNIYATQGYDSIMTDNALSFLNAEGKSSHQYFVCIGDFGLNFSTYQDYHNDTYYSLDMGRTYTFEIFPEGYNVNLLFDAKGDKAVVPTNYAHVITFIYDGLDIFILSNVGYSA